MFPGRPALWLAAAALTAFTRTQTYVNGVMKNDAVLGVVFTASAWLWARILRFGASLRGVVILGLLLGLGLNVKDTAARLILVSPILVALELGAGRRDIAERLDTAAVGLLQSRPPQCQEQR